MFITFLQLSFMVHIPLICYSLLKHFFGIMWASLNGVFQAYVSLLQYLFILRGERSNVLLGDPSLWGYQLWNLLRRPSFCLKGDQLVASICCCNRVGTCASVWLAQGCASSCCFEWKLSWLIRHFAPWQVITSYTIIMWKQFSWIIRGWTPSNFRILIRRLRS